MCYWCRPQLRSFIPRIAMLHPLFLLTRKDALAESRFRKGRIWLITSSPEEVLEVAHKHCLLRGRCLAAVSSRRRSVDLRNILDSVRSTLRSFGCNLVSVLVVAFDSLDCRWLARVPMEYGRPNRCHSRVGDPSDVCAVRSGNCMPC